MLSFVLFVWEFSIRHPGIVLVTVGVIGEGFEIAWKLREKITEKKSSKRFEILLEFLGAGFWIVLVVGLVLEMFDSGRIDSQLATAETDAAKADVLAEKIGTTNAELVAANLAERAKLDALELQLAETGTNIEKIVPLNQPIAQFFAHAVVVARSTRQYDNVGAVFGASSAHLTIVDVGKYAGEMVILGLGQNGKFKKLRWHSAFEIPDGKINSINPAGPDIARFDISFDQSDVSVWNRDSLTAGQIDMMYLKNPLEWGSDAQPFEVITGDVDMTINSSIQLHFSIPAQTNSYGFATSVNFNGVFMPMDIQ